MLLKNSISVFEAVFHGQILIYQDIVTSFFFCVLFFFFLLLMRLRWIPDHKTDNIISEYIFSVQNYI